MRRKYCILLLAALLPIVAASKVRLPHSYIKTYRLTEHLGLVDSVSSGGVDSSYINFAQRSILYDNSILNLYNGNIVSPVLSGIYFNRTDKTNFIFGRGYDVYTISPSDVNYFRTNIPYSYISYRRGLVSDGGDNDIDFLFTGNLSKATNFGVKINYLDGIGSYKNQAGRCIRGVVFGSYDGSVHSESKSDDRRGYYGISGAFSFNNLSNFENGGLLGSKSIFDAGGSSSDGGSVFRDLLNSGIQYKDLGVSMNAMSGYCYLNMNINHHYTFTAKQIIPSKSSDDKSDSAVVTYLPLFTIRHIMSVSDSHRRYLEKTASQNFYDNCYLNTLSTNDTCGSLSIDNTVSFNLDERYFYGLVTGNKRDTANLSYDPAEWLYLGLTLFVRNETKRYVNNLAANYEVGTIPLFQSGGLYDVIEINASRINRLPSRLEEVWYDNLYLGGSVYKRAGRYLRYSALAEICLLGREIGDVHIKGDVSTGVRIGTDSLSASLAASFNSQTPDYFLNHFVSNHYVWDNNFNKTYTFHISGLVEYPTRYVCPSLKVDYSTINNFIYFQSLSTPAQTNKTISVLAVDSRLDIKTPWVNLDNHIVYQYSSSEYIPLPMLTLYHNLYYHGTWFHALDTQIGVDMSYNTSYFAPFLNPAIGQFVLQNTEKVGNYPIMSAYANFFVKSIKLRLFAQYQHFNASFMNHDFFSMPAYPLNPDIFRLGLAFHFYN